MSGLIKKLAIALLVLAGLGILAYPKVQALISRSDSDDSSQNSEKPLNVDAVIVQPQRVKDKIFTTGTVQANEEVELSSEVSGKVVNIYLEEGKRVRNNQLLLKINDSELQAQLKRAQFRLDLATEQERRQEKLLEEGGISRQDYDATVNEVNVLRADIELIKAQIDKTEIRAPFDGIVGLKYISEGSYISPSTRVASLQDIDPAKINFSIPERYVNRVNEGGEITFSVQGTDREFTGEIYAIEPKIDSQTRTLQIRALSDNEEGLLVPGAFADIELTLRTVDDALMLPSIALVPELQGQKVYLYRNGSVNRQSVETGIRTEARVQVTRGIQPGDTVLTTGLLQVRPGMQVILNELQ